MNKVAVTSVGLAHQDSNRLPAEYLDLAQDSSADDTGHSLSYPRGAIRMASCREMNNTLTLNHRSVAEPTRGL